MAGNSVANAIVTIVPKLDQSGKKSLENQLEKTGESGGDKFGSKFGASLKKMAGAALVVEAGKLAGEVFAKSFTNAAEYEQLAGGVMKIFNEMDQSQIFADARSAYKDLNMSANDYLATINDVGAAFSASMGDQKGYDVARKGLTQIADFASGTGKNVDMLKDKFIAISRATSSYQSIADQFSGLLPATSADFLAQAQAAGILSSEYTKLTEVPVAEYQEALVAMMEKGNEQLGLLGNTAAETEGTVSGSLAALHASWENLLTAMGTGEDVEGAANQIVDSFITALKNIIPLAAQVIVGMGGALLTALGNLMVSGVNAIASKYGEFEQAAVNLIKGMVAGLRPDAVINKIKEICAGAVDAIKNFFGIHSPSTVMRDLFGYVGEGMALGLFDSQTDVKRGMDELLNTAYGRANSFSVGLNAALGGNGRATNADVVGAINRLEGNLYGIIKDATPEGMTQRQFGRAVRAYA